RPESLKEVLDGLLANGSVGHGHSDVRSSRAADGAFRRGLSIIPRRLVFATTSLEDPPVRPPSTTMIESRPMPPALERTRLAVAHSLAGSPVIGVVRTTSRDVAKAQAEALLA